MAAPRFTMRHRLIIIVVLVIANVVAWGYLLGADPARETENSTDVIVALST